MPTYRVHRLKDHLRASFRAAPHVIGTASIKPGHYEPGESIDAASPYAAFFDMKEAGTPLSVGDLLEAENGALRICKFVGFEEAHWVVADPKPETAADSVPESAMDEARNPVSVTGSGVE
jgi:hypothetical protein